MSRSWMGLGGREITRTRALTLGGGLLAVLLAVLVVVKVAGSGGEPLPDGEKRPEPMAFSDKPLWDEHKLGMGNVDGVELRGDVAIVAGDIEPTGFRLAVVDVRTGAPRWVVDDGHPLKGGDGAIADAEPGNPPESVRDALGKPIVYGDGDDWTVLVQYRKGESDKESEFGVAALSGRDGTVRWMRPLVRPKPDGDGKQRLDLLTADSNVVLASVQASNEADPRTVALDPSSGRELWRHEGGWAYRIAGGLVLGQTAGDKPSSAKLEGAGVFALDAKSGRQQWNLQNARLQAVAGGTALIRVSEKQQGRSYDEERTVVTDTATGRPAGKSPKSEALRFVYGCADDGRALIACAGSDGDLVTIRSGKHGEPFTTGRQPFGEDATPGVDLVRDDRIFVTRAPRSIVVDRAGNQLGDALPGAALAVSDRAAAFQVHRKGTSGKDGLVVHAAAVGRQPAVPPGPAEAAFQPPRIDAAPLWTATTGKLPAPSPAEDTGMSSLIGVELAGDAVVYTGSARDGDHVTKQVAAEAATGKVRWSVQDGTPLGGGIKADYVGVPRIVNAGGERLSLVTYEASGDEQGVAALSLDDGKVRWKKRMLTGDGYVYLDEAGDETFAVTVSRSGSSGKETVVYATGTRRELWREREVKAVGVGGNLVLAAKTEQAGNWSVRHVDLIAYGASDGEKRWNLAKRYPEPELLYDGGGKTVVVGTAEGGAVLDRATGRELAATSTHLTRCDGDGDAFIVCTAGIGQSGRSSAERAVTVRTTGGGTKINDLLETGDLTRYGAAGNGFAAVRPPAQDEPAAYFWLDGEGRRLAANLPGRPAEIGGGYAVLMPPPTDVISRAASSFTVHRTRG
ncbi:hypothetical protein E1293_10480 [Actinomadura darangshiensis]|uniref:Pyrrolo-quinoline quinone repeat domain-containing protein n=1 Tax=Actinomadura darangshiensis TaxID=705336 RepID=A0A4R5BPN7_9ACTN|nr:PQQ-binding-like beta-propeller repeat protein [Actinomadura darangshiensis]TDD85904.1 hypothetical protein E1293_10480 [Actinomadura darangshiensis]